MRFIYDYGLPGRSYQRQGQAQNYVKTILLHDAVDKSMGSHPYERHVHVTDEGVVIDIVINGEIVKSKYWEHHDLLDWDTEDNA